MNNIACIIMASGLGRRFGGNKLLAEFHGKPLIGHILEQTKGLFPRRVVVTRYREIEEICRRQGIDCVLHTLPGRNDTIRLGVEFFQADRSQTISKTGNPKKELFDSEKPPFHPKGYLFCPADQPLQTKDTLKKIAAEFSQHHKPGDIFRLSYGEMAGAPVLFDAVYAEELTKLPEKNGGSYLIRKYPCQVISITAASAAELMDVDTAEDLEQLSHMP